MGVVVFLLGIGFAFVLPQVVGFALARYGRWSPAVTWPLGAVGVVALYWLIMMVYDHHRAMEARAAGYYVCGESLVVIFGISFILFGLHAVVGRILGALEQQAQRPYGPDGGVGPSDSAS